jgi:hypothetical protein
MLGFVQALYPLLLVYGAAFVAIPVLRFLIYYIRVHTSAYVSIRQHTSAYGAAFVAIPVLRFLIYYNI